MAIDYNVFAQLKPPPPIDTPDEVEARQLKLEQARLQRQTIIQAAQDDAATRAAFKTHVGPDGMPDIPEVVKALYATNPRAADAVVKNVQAARKAQAETFELEDKHRTAMNDFAGQALQGSTAENWAHRFPVLQRVAPEVAQMFGPDWTPDMPDKVQAFTDLATKRKDKIDADEKAYGHYLAGDDDKAIARQINALSDQVTPEAVRGILTDARQKWGTGLETINKWAGLPSVEAVKETARKTELGQKEVETLAAQQQVHADALANTQADNARADDAAKRAEAAATESQRHNQVMEALARARLNKPPASQAAANDDAKMIADSIARGEQQPTLTGLYRFAAPVRAELAKQHYPLAQATEDWQATTKYLSTLNGQQQVRLKQAIGFTTSSLDLVEDLAKQWDAGGFPLLNKAQLTLAKNGALGPKAAAIATKLNAQIADVTSELGTVYKGGNSSTDESLKLAAQNLSTDWSKATLLSNLQQIRQNLTIRANSMKLAGVSGASPGNIYAPKEDAPPKAKPTAAELIKKYGG